MASSSSGQSPAQEAVGVSRDGVLVGPPGVGQEAVGLGAFTVGSTALVLLVAQARL